MPNHEDRTWLASPARSYLDAAEPITLGEVEARRARQGRRTAPARPRRGAQRVAWSAVATALAVIGGVVAIRAVSPGGDAANEVTAGPPPTTAVAVDDLDWVVAASGETFVGPVAPTVVAADGDEVLVGAANHEAPGSQIWRSEDGGTTWARTDDDIVADLTVTTIELVPGTGRAVAFARDEGSGAIVPLTADDGTSWASATAGSGAFTDAYVTDVAVSAGGLVAVGEQAGGGGIVEGAAWQSSDGDSWQRVTSDDFLPAVDAPAQPSFTDAVTVRAVTADGEGFVAVGRRGSSAVVWRSEDGSAWESVWTDRGAEGAAMAAILPFGDGFVAVGSANAEVQAWSSEDGVAWTVTYDGVLAGDVGLDSAAAADGLVVAAGEQWDGSLSIPIVVVSADGTSWTATDDIALTAPGAAVIEVVAGADGLLAIGSVGDEPTIWRGTVG